MADAVRPVVGCAAVLGGGPSLPSDLEQLPEDCVLIAVNHHALRVCAPHYMVFMDNPEKVPDLKLGIEAARLYKTKLVSPKREWSEVAIPKGAWDGGFSSTFATWFALWMGFEVVALCGMDCYQGDEKYFYERKRFYHPVFDSPLENHLRVWRQAFTTCPHPERIRAVSGPLVDIFGAFDA